MLHYSPPRRRFLRAIGITLGLFVWAVIGSLVVIGYIGQ